MAVLLPIGRVRRHSARNWRKQFAMRYPGDVTYSFVVSSEKSLAAEAIREFVRSVDSELQKRVNVVNAGQAAHCSQKNHKCAARYLRLRLYDP